MDIGILLFSSILNPAEQYLSGEFENKAKSTKNELKSSNSQIPKRLNKKSDIEKILEKSTLNTEIENAIEQAIESDKEHIITESTTESKNQNFMSKIVGYAAQAKETFRDTMSSFKNLYESFVGYVKSSYKSMEKGEKKTDPDCWQIGIDISRTCNFIFFPRKMKKISGILIDKGIMLDYINPSPVLCYF